MTTPTPGSGGRQRWILVSLCTLVVCSIGAYVQHKRANAKPAPPSIRYSVAQVTRGDLTRAVLTTGQLAPLVTVEVSTQISGMVTEVAVDFNTLVKKGDLLARIDPSTYRQKLKQAQADLAAAQASRELARLTAERQKALLDRTFVTQQEYDQSTAQLQQAEAVLLTRQAAVENAQVDYDRCTLTSPIDGIVIYKAADPGKTVQASFSAPTLFVIAQDLRKMQIIASISEVDVAAVRPGQPVTFTVEAFPDQIFHGRLKQVRNPYTPSDKQGGASAPTGGITLFDAVIEVDNPTQKLLPSLTANVSVIVDQRQNVLRLPNSALRVQLPNEVLYASPKPDGDAQNDDTVVYRLPDGNRAETPQVVEVRLGLTDSIFTEVVEGLRERDTVITGVNRPQDGGRRFRLF